MYHGLHTGNGSRREQRRYSSLANAQQKNMSFLKGPMFENLRTLLVFGFPSFEVVVDGRDMCNFLTDTISYCCSVH